MHEPNELLAAVAADSSDEPRRPALVGHDLNNVLSVLASSLYLLRLRGHAQDEREILDEMQLALERGKALAAELLDAPAPH